MIKKCKQCGRTLTAGESNKVCEKCRQNKRNRQQGVETIEKEVKKKKQ